MPTFHYATWSIGRTFYELKNERINIAPSYQREIVWNESKQIGVIQTLSEMYPLPPINLVATPESNFAFECIDGKNRLQSLWLYMTDKLPYNHELTPYGAMDESAQEAFKNIELQVCIFYNLDEHSRMDYFRRIQNGVTLNQTEIVWSMNDNNLVCALKRFRTKKADLIKQLWGTKRYTDLHLLFNVAAMILSDTPESASAGYSSAMTTWVTKHQTVSYDFKLLRATMAVVLQDVADIVPNTIHGINRNCCVIDTCRYIIVHKNTFTTKHAARARDFMDQLLSPTSCSSMYVKRYATLAASGIGSRQRQWTAKVYKERYAVLCAGLKEAM